MRRNSNRSTIKRYLIVLFILLFIRNIAFSSDTAAAEVLVLDTPFTIGELDNGLKYYIRPSSQKKNEVFMYIGVNMGSVDETDEEQGLAHYIEHMTSKSTEKYNQKDLEEIRNKLGLALSGTEFENAYTAYTKMIYNSSLQKIDDERLDLWFDMMSQRVLHTTFEKAAVDSERAVILSEKAERTSNLSSYQFNFMQDTFLHNTRFPKRHRIGKTKTILKANPTNLRNLYEKWYTPSNIVVIIIGDISVEKAKTYLTKYFNVTAKQESPPKPERYYGDATEVYTQGKVFPFLRNNYLTIAHTRPFKPITKYKDLKEYVLARALRSYIRDLYNNYTHQNSSTSNITDVSLFTGNLENFFETIYFAVTINAKQLQPGIEETKHFLSGAYAQLATEEALTQVKKYIAQYLDDMIFYTQNDYMTLANKAFDNFAYGFPFIDLAASAKKYKDSILNMLTHEDLQNYLDIIFESKTNRVIAANVVEADTQYIGEDGSVNETLKLEQLFSKEFNSEQFKGQFKSSFKSTDIDKIDIDSLIDTPASGEIVEEVYSKEFDTYIWKLSNGFTVYYKNQKTDTQKYSRIYVRSFNTSILRSAYRKNPFLQDIFQTLPQYASIKDLPFRKLINSFFPKWEIDTSGFSASSNRAYFEELLKKFYLIYTSTQISEEGAKSAKEIALLNTIATSHEPKKYNYIKIDNYKYSKQPHVKNRLDASQIEQISYDEINSFLDQMFRAKDNKLIIVTDNNDTEHIKTLVKQWVASIPSGRYYGTDKETKQNFPVDNNFSKTYIRPDTQDVAYVIYGTYEEGSRNSRKPENNSELKKLEPTHEIPMQSEDESQDFNQQRKNQILSRIGINYIDTQVKNKLRREKGLIYYFEADISLTTRPIQEQLFYGLIPTTVENAELVSREFKAFIDTMLPVDHSVLLKSKEFIKGSYAKYFYNNTYPLWWKLLDLNKYIVDGTVPIWEKDSEYVNKTIDEISEQELNDFLHDFLDNNSFTIITKPSKDTIEDE